MSLPKNAALVFILWLLMANHSFSQCQSSTSTTVANVCSGQLPYFWNGIVCRHAGMYSARLTNLYYCDSIANLILNVGETTASESRVQVCAQDFPYSWNGAVYNYPGTNKAALINSGGCDSFATLVLALSSAWVGGSSNNWNDSNNWSCHAVPNAFTDVTIDSGTVVVSADITVRSLTAGSAATVTVSPGYHIDISPSPVSGGPVFLTKVVRFDNVDSFLPPQSVNYHYDEADRLQSVVSTRISLEPGGGYSVMPPDSLIYFYNPGDTLPFKALHYSDYSFDTSGSFYSGEYYTYDSQARLTHRKWQAGTSSSELFYQYLPGQIQINGTIGNGYTLGYDGSNVTYRIMTYPNNPGWLPDTVHFQFANFQNPYHLVNIYRHTPEAGIYSGNSELVFNTNALEQYYNYRSGYLYQYQYDSIVNGLPGKLVVSDSRYTYTTSYFYYRH